MMNCPDEVRSGIESPGTSNLIFLRCEPSKLRRMLLRSLPLVTSG